MGEREKKVIADCDLVGKTIVNRRCAISHERFLPAHERTKRPAIRIYVDMSTSFF